MIASIFSNGFSRGLIAVASMLTLVATGSRAQERSAAQAQALVAHRQANEAAKTLATRGDLASAAQTLDALSSSPVGSAARHFETAQRLTLLASNLSRAGNAVAARATAVGALQYLTAADRQQSDPDLKAAIQGQMGFLHERYLGDVASAKAAYRAAAQLAPGNSAAAEKADRFEQTEANARKAGQAR